MPHEISSNAIKIELLEREGDIIGLNDNLVFFQQENQKKHLKQSNDDHVL